MSARLRPLEWMAIAIIVLALAYVAAGPPLSTGGGNVGDPLAAMTVGQSADGVRMARLDHDLWRAACEDAGLPDPPRLDGADPVPVRLILEQFRRWRDTRDLAALGNLGRIYLALEEHGAAIECFAALHTLDPEDLESTYFLGVTAQSLGRDDLAIAMLESTSVEGADQATTETRLGRLFLERGEPDRAERSFERARDLAPHLPIGYVGLGRVALARDDFEAAEAWLRQAIKATPNDHRAYRFLSQALGGLGRSVEADQAIKRAERLPHYAGWLVFDERLQATHVLANSQRYLENQLRVLQGGPDPERTAEVAAALLERRPNDHTVIAVVAAARVKLRQFPEARAAVARGLAVEPDSVPLLTVGAQIDMLQGEYDAALVTLGRALAIDPDDATAHDMRGRVLFLAERPAEALSALRRAIEIDAGRLNTRLTLAVMLQRMGRNAHAARELRAILEIEPEHAIARQRLNALVDGG